MFKDEFIHAFNFLQGFRSRVGLPKAANSASLKPSYGYNHSSVECQFVADELAVKARIHSLFADDCCKVVVGDDDEIDFLLRSR